MRNVFRLPIVFTMISLVIIIVTACGSEETHNQNDQGETNTSVNADSNNILADIKNNGRVVVGTEAAFQPFEYIQDGEIVGYGSDILKYIIDDLGVEMEQENIPWQGILPGLDSKRFDFVATAVSITPERAEKYAFTVPIADGTLAFLKRKGDDSIQKPEDIAGKVVGSQLSSGQMKTLKEYNKELESKGEGAKDIKEYVEYPEAYQALATGRIDAVANSKANLSIVIQERPDEFEMTETFGVPMWFSWVVRKDKASEDLLEYLNEKILELKDNGQLDEMQEKWFGFTMETPDSDFLPE